MADGEITEAGRMPLADAERAAAYRWLAGLFVQEPTPAVLAAYASPDGAALLGHLGALASLAPAADALATLAADPDPRARALDLAGAYARLFHGVGGRNSAPPYASVYTSERGLTHQQATAAAEEDLARLNLRLADHLAEPPDHLSVTLSVMAELVETGSHRAQAEHLDTRLLPWIGDFREDCIAGDRHGFYAVAARCLVEFIEADRLRLAPSAR